MIKTQNPSTTKEGAAHREGSLSGEERKSLIRGIRMKRETKPNRAAVCGPRPKLTAEDHRHLEAWMEEARPWLYGWLRSHWSCLLLALQLFRDRGEGFFFGDETKLELNPRVGFAWIGCAKGSEAAATALATLGTNRKLWISGLERRAG